MSQPTGSLYSEPSSTQPSSDQPSSTRPSSEQPSSAPSFEPPRPATPSVPPMSASDERSWAVGAHLSGFVAAYLALGFIGPLVVMLTGGARSAYVRRHAVEALNFNLSVLIWLAVSAVLSIILIGLPMLLAVGVLYVVASIQGALAAGRGEEFRYPITIRFVS
jgi:uncharacterized Tic20 family protein